MLLLTYEPEGVFPLLQYYRARQDTYYDSQVSFCLSSDGLNQGLSTKAGQVGQTGRARALPPSAKSSRPRARPHGTTPPSQPRADPIRRPRGAGGIAVPPSSIHGERGRQAAHAPASLRAPRRPLPTAGECHPHP